MKLWFALTEEKRKELSIFQRKHFKVDLKPPKEETKGNVHYQCLENTEEIDKLIRQAPYHVKGDGFRG